MKIDSKTPLGQFAKIFEVNGAFYTLRGLTFSEYTDLLSRVGFDSVKTFMSDMAYLVCKHGILNWSGIYYEDDLGATEEVICSDETIDELDFETIIILARHIIEDMTLLTDLEEDKFRGHIRLIYYLSDEKFGETRRKQFDCKTCVKSGWYNKRKCTLPSLEFLIEQNNKEEEKNKEDKIDRVGALIDKRRHRKKKFANLEELEASKSTQSGAISIPGMNFPECPISWIEPWIKTMADGLYDSSKSNKQFFDGGTADQLYKIYKAQRVVGGEAGKIESEQMKEKRKK